ncbi:MAG: HAMP domain-containing sensor histidine kinase [Pacificimonas sp.]
MDSRLRGNDGFIVGGVKKLKSAIKRRWPPLRLRVILFAALFFVAALPGVAAVSLRVYENTLVRQTEAELIAQGAALAAAAAVNWPGAVLGELEPPAPPAATSRAPVHDAAIDADSYWQPETLSIDLNEDRIMPPRPPARPPATAGNAADPDALSVSVKLRPVVTLTRQRTLAAIQMTDARGTVVLGDEAGGSYADLPEIRAALAGNSSTLLRRRSDYQPRYSFEWLSRAAALRLHHARPIIVNGEVVGALILSRSSRALFRGLYQDWGKILAGALAIFAILLALTTLLTRGIARPIEALSRSTRAVAEGAGDVPAVPPLAATEIQQLYRDFADMAATIERRSHYLKDFAAAVSHEFKTPLAGIGGAIEILEDHGDTMSAEERVRFQGNIAGDAARLSALVGRLMELARADMARPDAPLGGVNINPPLFRAADAQSNAEFRVQLSLDGLPHVNIGEATLETVATILIDNAKKAGARRVGIEGRHEGGDVALFVTDDGPGIAAGDRARLFTPFFTTRRAEGGTGLGLAIARSLLAAGRGRIGLIESDSGAAFRIDLPAV